MKIMGKLQLKGVLPPMITPFKENGDVDYDAYSYNIDKWNGTGLMGYLTLGSNSETAFLSEDEKLELIKLTVSGAAKDKLVMVGTGLDSIRDTIKLTNKAAALGAKAALILTPSFYKSAMNSPALIDYFTQVADHTDIPVLLYNVPKYTCVNIGADAVAKLSEHPNIIGMKDSSGNVPQLATFLRVAADDFNVMVGTAGAWYPALTLGVKAGIHALANCCPNECVKMQELFDAGDWEASKDLYQKMCPVNAAVTGTYGIAGLKYGCELLGYKGGYVRSPLQELKDSQKEDLRKIYRTAGLID
jgi:4-hydroxy-2-oxoglutarate aldolase